MTNSFTTKKVVALAMGLALAFSAVFVTTARAATNEELQAQISNLLAMIATLQAQLGGSNNNGGSNGSCTPMQFTLSHKKGDNGGEVMNIQKFLNMDSATQVASTGAGSPGNETSYFGPATKAAVIKFQNKYASEVLAPVGLATGTGYWGSSSRAKANAMEIARCASSNNNNNNNNNSNNGTGTDLTVSAAAQPGNGLAVESAANLPFTKFTLTAGASDMTFDSVTVELTGLADKAAFSSVALLDENGNQVGITKTLNSNDQANVGETTTIPAGMSKTFTVVGNMKSSLTNYAGQVASLSVVAVNSSSTVAGSLPITGAQHTINSSLTIGTATAAVGVDDPDASKSKEIGTTGYKFQAIKITAGSAEDIRVKSVRWNQSGSASASDLSNVKLTFDGNTYTPTVSGDYYTFNFGSGVVIKKGLSKEMVLSADIVNGSASTIIFDIRKDTDLIVTGETYGYGITPTATAGSASSSSSDFTSSTPWFDGVTVTITGGSFNSVSKSNAAPAADIAEQVADTVLGAFEVDIKGEPITVESLKFDTVTTDADSGGETVQITNVVLTDQNGTVLAGPEDSTSYTIGGTDTDVLTFSSVSFPTGVTTMYVKGQLDSNWESDDKIKLKTDPSSQWTNVVGDNTGDTISTSAMSAATANEMTVKTVAMTAITLSQPVARSVVKGAKDFVWATGSLSTSDSGEDVKVSAVKIQDVTTSAADVNDILNVEIWADLTSATSSRGDVYETKVSNTEQFDASAAGADVTLNFVLDNQFVIAKNSTVNIAVVADLSASAVGTVGTDKHTIDIDAVTASGVTTSADASDTSVTGGGQAMTIASTGAVTVSLDSSSPDAKLILDDTSTEQEFAVFKFKTTDVEAVKVRKMTVTAVDTADDDAVAKYVFYDKSGNKLGEATPDVTANTAEVTFSTPLEIAADTNTTVKVKAVMANVDGTAVQNGDSVGVKIAAAGDLDVIGVDSATAITPTLSSPTGNTHTLYEAYPEVAVADSGASKSLTANAAMQVMKVTISNPGDKEINFLNGSSNVFKVTLRHHDASGTATMASWSMTDGTNTLCSAPSLTLAEDTDNTVTCDFATNSLTVPAGGSKDVYVYANTSSLTASNSSVYAYLKDTAATIKFDIDSDTGNYDESTTIFNADTYGPTYVTP